MCGWTADIRAGRFNPGLQAQHVAGLKLVSELSGAELTGASNGSPECNLIIREPINMTTKESCFQSQVDGAGSTALQLQIALPLLIYAGRTMKLKLCGGTDASFAPPFDWMQRILIPQLGRLLDLKLQLECVRRGFFPKGGGVVECATNPIHQLHGFELINRGSVIKIRCYSTVGGQLPRSIVERMASSAIESIRCRPPIEGFIQPSTVEIVVEHAHDENCVGVGAAIVLVAETDTGCLFGGSSLGKRGVPAEIVGQEAESDLWKQISSGGCVDEHLQDQLLVFMALAAGRSKLLVGPITLHSRTSIEYLLPMFTSAKFRVVEQSNNTHIIECDGCGFTIEN